MESWIFIVAAIVVILLITFGVGYFRTKNVDGKKPYQPREINTTNYNVAATFTDEQLQNMTPAEAREVVRKAEAGEETSLSEQDFFRLKGIIDGKGPGEERPQVNS